MRWTINEFLFEMDQDPNRRVLFVEGMRDIAFWREILPIVRRQNAQIYAIASIDIHHQEGGERGRLLQLAQYIAATGVSDRVHFFADADYDRILQKPAANNVTLTDGRDLESYGITNNCIMKICLQGFAKNEEQALQVFPQILDIVRPIGILRVVNEKHQAKLPFQKTIGEKGFRKFLIADADRPSIDLKKITTALLQNANSSLEHLSTLLEAHGQELEVLSPESDDQIVHGKDFLWGIAWKLGINVEESERLLFLCIDYDSVRKNQNISHVEGWLQS